MNSTFHRANKIARSCYCDWEYDQLFGIRWEQWEQELNEVSDHQLRNQNSLINGWEIWT